MIAGVRCQGLMRFGPEADARVNPGMRFDERVVAACSTARPFRSRRRDFGIGDAPAHHRAASTWSPFRQIWCTAISKLRPRS